MKFFQFGSFSKTSNTSSLKDFNHIILKEVIKFIAKQFFKVFHDCSHKIYIQRIKEQNCSLLEFKHFDSTLIFNQKCNFRTNISILIINVIIYFTF